MYVGGLENQWQETCLDLTSCKLEAIQEASIDVPDPLFVYPHLLLKESSLLKLAVKWNNSCVKYTKNNSDCFGVLQKLSAAMLWYSVLIKQCYSSVTHAKLNEHICNIVTCWRACCAVLRILMQSIVDKCIIMEVQSKQDYVLYLIEWSLLLTTLTCDMYIDQVLGGGGGWWLHHFSHLFARLFGWAWPPACWALKFTCLNLSYSYFQIDFVFITLIRAHPNFPTVLKSVHVSYECTTMKVVYNGRQQTLVA